MGITLQQAVEIAKREVRPAIIFPVCHEIKGGWCFDAFIIDDCCTCVTTEGEYQRRRPEEIEIINADIDISQYFTSEELQDMCIIKKVGG